MGHIFISYARDDAAFAARLGEGFESGGFSVWMDTRSLAGGEQWTKEIETAIEAAALVVVVSHSSNQSEWVRREVLYAQQLDKQIVPVLAAQVRLPSLLIDRHALALHEDFATGFARLLKALPEMARPDAPVAAQSPPPVHPGGALWLLAGASLVVVAAVIAVRGESLAGEVLTTGLIIGGVLLAMAWKADDAISLQFKRDLSLWLAGLDPAAVDHTMQRWPAHFAALFDRVFGNKHLSWRCAFRSSIASFVAFLLCTPIFLQAAPGEWAYLLTEVGGWDTLIRLGIVGAIANLLPDYVSLLETRWVIQRMQRTPSIAAQAGWLLLDFVATAAIFFLFVGIVTAAIPNDSWRLISVNIWLDFELGGSGLDFIADLVRLSLLSPVSAPETRLLAIPVWTTYFTTVWVWLYFLAQFLVRLAIPLRRALGSLQYALPIEQRPLRAVGLVMALVACAGYSLVMLPASTFGGSDAPLKAVEPEMVVIEPGEFRMGDLSGKGDSDEGPAHRVVIAKRFAIGKYEVSFEEYERFARATNRPLPDDERWGRGKRPVIYVSWKEATAYAKWLSEQTGARYRLPTEAEWEYAARAGTETRWSFSDKEGDLGKHAWHWENSNNKTHPIGEKEPNPWGLHDVHGNVLEWVADCWHEDYDGAPNDGSAWEEEGSDDCGRRVLRGGAWDNQPRNLRSATRYRYFAVTRYNDIGFRPAQDL